MKSRYGDNTPWRLPTITETHPMGYPDTCFATYH